MERLSAGGQLPPQVYFHPWGLWNVTHEPAVAVTKHARHQMRSLSTIMQSLGLGSKLQSIALIKLDCEGCEFGALEAIQRMQPRQLAVELHTHFGHYQLASHGKARSNVWLRRDAAGMDQPTFEPSSALWPAFTHGMRVSGYHLVSRVRLRVGRLVELTFSRIPGSEGGAAQIAGQIAGPVTLLTKPRRNEPRRDETGKSEPGREMVAHSPAAAYRGLAQHHPSVSAVGWHPFFTAAAFSANPTARHPLSRLHTDGYAVLPAALPAEAIEALRQRAVETARHHAGIAGLGGAAEVGLSFPDLLAPHRDSALRPLLEVPLASAAVKGALAYAFNGSKFAFNGMCDLQFNRSITWHRDLLHPPYMALQKHDVWQPAHKHDIYALYRLVIYLESHEHDDSALSVLPGSHLYRGCKSKTCGKDHRGYVEHPKQMEANGWAAKPVVLRPAMGDVVIFDQRLIHRGQAQQEPMQSPRITIQISFGRTGSVFTEEYAQSFGRKLTCRLVRGLGGRFGGFGLSLGLGSDKKLGLGCIRAWAYTFRLGLGLRVGLMLRLRLGRRLGLTSRPNWLGLHTTAESGRLTLHIVNLYRRGGFTICRYSTRPAYAHVRSHNQRIMQLTTQHAMHHTGLPKVRECVSAISSYTRRLTRST